MSDCLHCMAFTQKITQTDLTILYFEFFNHYCDLPPSSSIYDTVAALADLALYLQLLPANFDVWIEFTMLGDSCYLEFGWSLDLFILFAGQLTFLE